MHKNSRNHFRFSLLLLVVFGSYLLPEHYLKHFHPHDHPDCSHHCCHHAAATTHVAETGDRCDNEKDFFYPPLPKSAGLCLRLIPLGRLPAKDLPSTPVLSILSKPPRPPPAFS